MSTAGTLHRAGWEIKTEEDLRRVLSQAEVVKSGSGTVLRLRGFGSGAEDHASLDLPPASEWDGIGERGQTAKLLYQSGLKTKAYRYGRCGRYVIPLQGHDLFCDLKGRSVVSYRCGLRFCQTCAPKVFRALFDKYRDGFTRVVEQNALRSGYVLARLDFTIRCDGHEPKPEEIRVFNRAVRRLIRRLFPKLKARCDYGLEWCDEFGHPKSKRRAVRVAKGWNLHAHGVWFGPYIEWRRGRDLWKKLTGSTGFWVKKIKRWNLNIPKAVSHALGHSLKYVSKLPGETPERIAGLERAFDGVVKVHRMGFFYDLPRGDDRSRPGEKSWTCPHCGRALFPERPFRIWPVSELGPGMVNIDQLEKSMAGSFGLRVYAPVKPATGRAP